MISPWPKLVWAGQEVRAGFWRGVRDGLRLSPWSRRRSPSRSLADWAVTQMTITVDRPDLDDLRSAVAARHHQALLDAEHDRGIGPRYGPPAG